MILFYLHMVLTTWAGWILLPWSAFGVLASLRSPKAFALFFGGSLIVATAGAILLFHYASDPVVDGDGTTMFGAAFLIGAVFVWGFLTFLICGVLAVISARRRERPTRVLETN